MSHFGPSLEDPFMDAHVPILDQLTAQIEHIPLSLEDREIVLYLIPVSSEVTDFSASISGLENGNDGVISTIFTGSGRSDSSSATAKTTKNDLDFVIILSRPPPIVSDEDLIFFQTDFAGLRDVLSYDGLCWMKNLSLRKYDRTGKQHKIRGGTTLFKMQDATLQSHHYAICFKDIMQEMEALNVKILKWDHAVYGKDRAINTKHKVNGVDESKAREWNNGRCPFFPTPGETTEYLQTKWGKLERMGGGTKDGVLGNDIDEGSDEFDDFDDSSFDDNSSIGSDDTAETTWSGVEAEAEHVVNVQAVSIRAPSQQATFSKSQVSRLRIQIARRVTPSEFVKVWRSVPCEPTSDLKRGQHMTLNLKICSAGGGGQHVFERNGDVLVAMRSFARNVNVAFGVLNWKRRKALHD
ncbi:hypothetical protein B0J14DRAFT_568317 [Halenospora varia]|nr:hypothetical protein B0J14DRAFT_568317 [Halenospora varia]